jgi:hypothetical protein
MKGARIGLLAGCLVGAIFGDHLVSIAFFAVWGLVIGDVISGLLSLETK